MTVCKYPAILLVLFFACIFASAEDTPLEPEPVLTVGSTYNLVIQSYDDKSVFPGRTIDFYDTCTVTFDNLKYQIFNEAEDVQPVSELSLSITIERKVKGLWQNDGDYVWNVKANSDGSYSATGPAKKIIFHKGSYRIIYNGLSVNVGTEVPEPEIADPLESGTADTGTRTPAKSPLKKRYIQLSATLVCTAPDPGMLVHQSPDPETAISQYGTGSALGSYGVSETGAATYSMPIELPVNKFTPNLSLTYNSQSSCYGLAGYGVNISGISAITRIGKNHFYDNDYKGVTFTDDDSFALDGKRLVRTDSSQNNGDEVVYSIEGDPYTVVVRHGSNENTWFAVLDNAGVYYEFGNTAASKNSLDGMTVAEWYVNYAVDANNNYAVYDYERGNHVLYPRLISYGYNNAYPSGSISTVTFEYQSLGENARPFMIRDKQGSIDKCLKSITTATDGNVFRKYLFDYDSTSDKSVIKYTRLTGITKQNGAGESMTPVKLSWSALPDSKVSVAKLRDELLVSDIEKYELGNETEAEFASCDINSDGVSDIIKISRMVNSEKVTYIATVSLSKKDNSGGITFSEPTAIKFFDAIKQPEYDFKPTFRAVLDLDADGYNDLLFSATFIHKEKYWDSYFFYPGKYLSGYVLNQSGNILSHPMLNNAYYIGIPKESLLNERLSLVSDINGDGKDDLIHFLKKSGYNEYTAGVIEYNNNQAYQPNLFTLKFSKKIKSLFSGDYNNDGLTDIIFFYEGGYTIYFNNGGNDISKLFSESNKFSSTDIGYKTYINQGDFDGDGLIDFVYTDHPRLRIARNNGNGTFTIVTCEEVVLVKSIQEPQYSLTVCDINHDGCSDVVLSNRGYFNFEVEINGDEALMQLDKSVLWLYSDGNNLRLLNKSVNADIDKSFCKQVFTGDFDGDGYYEVANYGGRIDPECDVTKDTNFYVYRSSYRSYNEGRIYSISDGTGNDVRFKYSTLANPAVYKAGKDLEYPLINCSSPVSVVSNLSDGKNNINYFYETLRYHADGRGSLGFSRVSKENTVTGVKQVSEITGWDESLYVPTQTVSRTIIGTDTATVVTTNSITRLKNTYICLPEKETTVDFDGNQTVTEYTYDTSLGVPSTTKTTYGDSGIYTKTHTYAYTYAGRKYVPMLIDTEKKHPDDPSIDLKRSELHYDDNGNITQRIDNKLSDKPLTTVFTYDAAGNVLSKKTTGQNVTPVTKHFEYDDSRRYVTRTYTSPATADIMSVYDIYGNLLSETDATVADNPLKRTMTYDGWGRLLTETAPEGNVTIHRYGFGRQDRYRTYCRTDGADGSIVTKWFDCQGRETLVKSVGIGGIDISKATYYNEKGQTERIESYQGRLKLTTTNTYDQRGRLLTTGTTRGTTVSYVYGNRMVQTNRDGRISTTRTDAAGNVVSVSDPAATVSYRYYSSGKPSSVTTDGSTVTMEYDDLGNRTRLVDPDAGTITASYAADGTLLSQTDGRGVTTTYTFDNVGRVTQTRIGDRTVTDTYGTEGYAARRLVRRSCGNNHIDYSYDSYGRLISEKRTVEGNGQLEYRFEYNAKGQLAKTVYPGGLEVTYSYDENGYRTGITADGRQVWQFADTDGRTSHATTLGTLRRTHSVDYRGYTTFIGMKKILGSGRAYADSIRLVYDGPTGNLLSRRHNRHDAQEYTYDDMDRLLTVTSGDTPLLSMEYDTNGNIINKSDVGDYGYDSSRPHAVTRIDNASESIPSATQTVEFGELGKVTRICEDDLEMTFDYGPDGERWHSQLMRDGAVERATVYAGTYERVISGDTIREFYYLDNGVVVVRQNGGAFTPYVLFADEQGSVLTVADKDGNRVFEAAYDAWGRQTVSTNTIGFTRGYTGHEMLAEFGIINMGGRLYDPVLGRFFSPDNYVQAPTDSQNFNRYSYCLNNPLKYTDPTGQLINPFAVLAIFNIGKSLIDAAMGKSSWKTALFNIASAALTYGIGQAFGTVGGIGHELLRAGAHGLSTGVFTVLGGGNFGSGFVSGALASVVGSYTTKIPTMSPGLRLLSSATAGGFGSWASGGDFMAGAVNGMRIWSLNDALHGAASNSELDKLLNQPSRPVNGVYVDADGYCQLPEVVCYGSGGGSGGGMIFHDGAITIRNALDITSTTNTLANSWATALIDYGAHSTVGTNGRFYFHSTAERYFYGNQHVRTYKLTAIGYSIKKFTGPAGMAIGGLQLGGALITDIQTSIEQKRINSYNTAKTSSELAGSWAGAKVGIRYGAILGAKIGAFFGVGIIPSMIIGGAVGGFVGAYFGESLCGNILDLLY